MRYSAHLGRLAFFSMMLIGIVLHSPSAMGQLYQAPNITKWPYGLVPICFVAPPPQPEASWIEDALKTSWSAVARIGFIYFNSCPFPNHGSYVRLEFIAHDSSSWGARGFADRIGIGSPTTVQVWYCAPGNTSGCRPGEPLAADYEEAFRAAVIHELGHALGFLHEQQRPDATPSCRLEVNKSDNRIIVNGELLTTIYDPDSIMNYCRGLGMTDTLPFPDWPGYHAADKLSSGDIAGAKKAYGSRTMSPLVIPASVRGGLPQTFTVFASDSFGSPMTAGEVFLNGVKIGTVGKPISRTFKAKFTTVCRYVPPACHGRPRHCSKPRRDCSRKWLPYKLEVLAPHFEPAAVSLAVLP